MDIRALRYFVELVREQSFTRASEKLFVTQPTISKMIRNMEEELGQPLLSRVGRRFTLTDSGQVLFTRAQTILAEMQQLEGMLERILDIQHPERVKEKLLVKSLENPQQVVLRQVGQLLGVDPAQPERVWRRIDAGVSAAAQSLPPAARSLRVYYEVSAGGYAAGTQSFIGEMMARLGVQNIVTPELGPFPRINPEYVVRANPDLIMIGVRNVQGMAQRPGWSGMKALREQRVCVFTEAESDVLVRPGPRMAEAARVMARCISEKGLR